MVIILSLQVRPYQYPEAVLRLHQEMTDKLELPKFLSPTNSSEENPAVTPAGKNPRIVSHTRR